MPFGLGFFATAGGAPAGAYELISTQVLGSNTASVTFSSLATIYQHLQIRMVARGSNVSQNRLRVAIRFNGVTSSSYAGHELFGNGSSVNSQNATSQTRAWSGAIPDGAVTANSFGANVIDILDFNSSAKNTTVRALGGSSDEAKSIGLYSGLFVNTAAVTSITLLLESGDSFVTNSRFSLYGLRG